MAKNKKKPDRSSRDTSEIALKLHRDYPIFHTSRMYNESYTRVDGVMKENGDYQVTILDGERSLDGKDLSIFHYLATAIKHNKKEEKGYARISMSKLCECRGLPTEWGNIRRIEESFSAMMSTRLRIVPITNAKMNKILIGAGADINCIVSDFDKLVSDIKKIRNYVLVPLISKIEVNGDIAEIWISPEYLSSMEDKRLFIESKDMQKLSSLSTIAYETLQVLVGGVDKDNIPKQRSFRENDLNKRLEWDKLNDAALRKRWSLLNKEWQERTSLPEYRRKTINGVVWRVPKERKMNFEG